MSEKASSPWARFWGGTAGLSVIIVCSLLMVLLGLFTSKALRIIFSLAFILFFPVYTLISALFPAKGRLEGIERFAVTFAAPLTSLLRTGLERVLVIVLLDVTEH